MTIEHETETDGEWVYFTFTMTFCHRCGQQAGAGHLCPADWPVQVCIDTCGMD